MSTDGIFNCDKCGLRGVEYTHQCKFEKAKCATCRGTGKTDKYFDGNYMEPQVPCWRCKGSGIGIDPGDVVIYIPTVGPMEAGIARTPHPKDPAWWVLYHLGDTAALTLEVQLFFPGNEIFYCELQAGRQLIDKRDLLPEFKNRAKPKEES